ncbi:aldehyde dehydrogenase family protein [Mucilaginibacter pallidiroseus]|uniref:Aldehyde dehydrogenase family protein n=1 Tax=Mucilaginibacter pallidiroseus TaxID=2599295 RepID=A0A563TZ12_9SPHI|nr:aldehyde dehydrogenase family protein [Mucilaginibacter pallidiroseus]TWR24370.1 aldehyde dehydrogenase family protein [Mucilaginibacter pallidiroseus]
MKAITEIDQIFINGKFVTPNGTGIQDLFDPSTAKIIGRVRLGDATDVNQAVSAAKAAFRLYSVYTVGQRKLILEKIYHAISANQDKLNEAAVAEYGSPLTATKFRTSLAAQFFLDASHALDEIEFEKKLDKAVIIKEPVGVVAAVTPWNADYIHMCGKIAPALAAGCTVVIKPSEFNAIETQLLTECFRDAGIPDGLINIVNGTGAVVGSALSSHPDVALVSFTGSTQTGKTIFRSAADTVKRLVLELGGKSPNILLDDCDFEAAVPRALLIAFSNSGQACHAGTRLIVPENKLPLVSELLTDAVNKLKIGDLFAEDAQIGPMINAQQYQRVQSYIQKGIDEGATLLAGGPGHPDGLEGFYVRPTVFTNVSSDMSIAREEIFGPVLSVLTYCSEYEAVSIANDSIYGLSAYISSADTERAKQLAKKIESGRVIINSVVNSEPKTPFGGFKQSGIGRTGWTYGIEMHLEPKVIAF